MMLGSQSSLDDAIANMCTGEFMAQGSKKDDEEQMEKKMGKENIANNDLHSFLDEGDEDFLELNY